MAAALAPRQIVLLSGPMGAGKTALVAAVAEALGPREDQELGVCSPTFAIHNRYETARGAIDHFDLYRVEGEADLESTGLWDLLASAGPQLVFIEWPERINENDLPRPAPRPAAPHKAPAASADWELWRVEIELVPGAPEARRIRCERARQGSGAGKR
jgi:tRNA threonylcarbamoyl adenosine modification protein YjeE